MTISPAVDDVRQDLVARATGQTLFTWLANGRALFRCVQDAIALADRSIDVEFYMYKSGALGDALRDLLIAAAERGCRVRVLIDAYGSDELPAHYWRALSNAGAEVRWFNPKRLLRLSFRDHRKLVVVDASHAIVGGCNVSDEYAGDGVRVGWRDMGVSVSGGDIVHALQRSFMLMWKHAAFGIAAITHFRQWRQQLPIVNQDCELLLAGAGMNTPRLRARLYNDIARGSDIQILAAYFLPSRRLRALLSQRAATASVTVVVPAIADVALAQWANQYIIGKMQQSGVRFYTYQPAMLHAKLVVVDDIVYVGSANLDVRSHRINYELLLRIRNSDLADHARATFESVLADSVAAKPALTTDSLATRWRDRLAYLVLSRLDPYIAQRKLRNLQ
ncbi:MAG: phosphatidylserine/phosphatidylglycerophosphate/cardiolipin synthase family protein [Pseudomonadota bacterium]|nr:phosphatidylserine/phosphatidylglycerophosphate/cardiolipin synthase family protein [Pseudomonadota bacterium]